MLDRYEGYIFIVLGLYFMIFRRFGARLTVKWNLWLVGKAASERTYEWIYLIGGISVIILGIRSLIEY